MWGVIGNENGRHRQTKLIQRIIISHLINYSSSVDLWFFDDFRGIHYIT